MKSAVGLADLACLLRVLPAAQHADAAALLGLEAEVVSRKVGASMSVMVAEQAAAAAPQPIDERARFLRVEAASETGAPIPARPPPVARLTAAEVRSAPGRSLPPTPPLAPWSTIVSRMRAALRGSRRGRDPDVRALVRIPQLVELWAHAFDGVADARLPATISPAQLPGRGEGGPQTWMIGQRGGELIFVPFEDEGDGVEHVPASQVAMIAAATPEIWVQRGGDDSASLMLLAAGATVPVRVDERLTLRTDLATVSLGVWERQPWAVAAGRDRYGLWAAFEVGGVRQRMRWIPPGRFLMGSPEGEDGRYKDEGPQHLVTITAGYWLGETPVTQALWRAVMGNNPSRFVSDERPVEQVSWNDCQAFIERVNARLDGARGAQTHWGEQLRVRLPTEAEWERACRAGTTTATWVGDLAIEGRRSAPLLDDIAWYGGNSGLGFDLESGADSSEWPDKQHPHTRAGTHPVGLHDAEPRYANPYGLYDMLGNVYEWCQDAGRDRFEPFPYTETPLVEGKHELRSSSVNRGGSWYSNASHVRAAYRLASPPVFASDDLGFRLAGATEPRSGERGRGAGRDPTRAEERDATTPGDSGPAAGAAGAARTTAGTTLDGPRGRRRR